LACTSDGGNRTVTNGRIVFERSSTSREGNVDDLSGSRSTKLAGHLSNNVVVEGSRHSGAGEGRDGDWLELSTDQGLRGEDEVHLFRARTDGDLTRSSGGSRSRGNSEGQSNGVGAVGVLEVLNGEDRLEGTIE
jgi:hypothetical protein